jgi:hypothetical protein
LRRYKVGPALLQLTVNGAAIGSTVLDELLPVCPSAALATPAPTAGAYTRSLQSST